VRTSFGADFSTTFPSASPREPALGDHRPHPGRRVEGAEAGAARAEPLGQRALRGQLDRQLAVQVLAGELLVLPDVRRDDAADPPLLEQEAEAGAVDAAVVGDHGQVVGPLLDERLDEEPRDAGEAEPADGQAGPAGDVGDRCGGRRHHLVQGCHRTTSKTAARP
jgi:hypothetical protein